MKKVGLIFALLIFALSLSAQLRTGEIQGKVVSKEGLPLSGVKITLSRPQAADQKAVTGASGIFRLLAVPPAADYSLKAEHPDFKTIDRPGVVVELGGRVAVNFVLEPGKPEEIVKVATPTPIVDRARFTTGASFGWTVLQTLPTARDPWVIVQLVPRVMLDRENVGGNESSEQSHFVTGGDNTNGIDNTWVVDGIDVTDPVDLGLSDVNFDFDAIDVIAVTTGGAADVTQQTAGIAVNLLTRRGGNRMAGAARFFLTDHAFQADNLTTTLRSQGVPNTNKIQQIRDFGASVGGPIAKDRLWFWLAYGVQDLFSYTIYDFEDRVLFSNYNFKINAVPFAGNRAEVLFTTSSKE
ncbi:MAG TPA: carboxypeptidase-like regulatory domain-containing protein, partial [Acidobacteriota bacterium]|nr:carboxypeptidase-like regulatory domain-containing protein [Acidobacteriota bacterium]